PGSTPFPYTTLFRSGTLIDRQAPVQVQGSIGLQDVTVGDHACATDGNGRAWCWGDNGQYQLAIASDTTDRTVPTGPISGMAGLSVASAKNHTCALSGTYVVCWGDNSYGKAGTSIQPAVPAMAVTNISDARAVYV